MLGAFYSSSDFLDFAFAGISSTILIISVSVMILFAYSLLPFLSSRYALIPAASAPLMSVSSVSPTEITFSFLSFNFLSAISNSPSVLSFSLSWLRNTPSNSSFSWNLSSTGSTLFVGALLISASLTFFSFSAFRVSIVSGYIVASNLFLFQTPMSFSITIGIGLTLNAAHTAVNAVVWSSYFFVIRTLSNCSANCPNGILTRKMLKLCLRGEYVPFSTNVPQKSKNTALTIFDLG